MMATHPRFNWLLRGLAVGAMTLASSASAGEVNLNQLPVNTVYTSGTVQAGRQHGPYWGAQVGWATDFSVGTKNDLSGFTAEDKGGWNAGLRVGYLWQTPSIFRPGLEVQLDYVDNEVRASNGSSDFRADMYHISLMVNAVLALDFSEVTPDSFLAMVHPYVGVGVGGAYSSVRGQRIDGPLGSKSYGDSSRASIAYQIFGGVEVDFSEYVSVFGEVRHYVIDDVAGGLLSDADQNLWNLGVKVNY